jgi:hypothetical protein
MLLAFRNGGRFSRGWRTAADEHPSTEKRILTAETALESVPEEKGTRPGNQRA